MRFHTALMILALATLLTPAAIQAAPPKGTQQKLADLEQEIDKLEGEVATLTGVVGTLSMDLADAVGRIETLEMEVGAPQPVLGWASANGNVSVVGTEWINIPDMSVETDVEGTAVIRFCSETGTLGQGSGRLKARVDGVDILTGSNFPPGAILQSYSLNGPVRFSCFQWVVDGLEGGTHVFDLQYRTFGDETFVNTRVLTVEGTAPASP